ncbi:hypothetical protein [Acetivibrio clariflavus]|jgi:hypothetical protein|uniref:hypothetical protein n=1 Tax=Acetivibrio clariflavus TaxID=288965 RepID=UPI00048448BE|nr:hypothetical protein [Acetivibrio clariflavus]
MKDEMIIPLIIFERNMGPLKPFYRVRKNINLLKCSLEQQFFKKLIDMFPQTYDIKNDPQTLIPSTRAMLSAWY